MVSPRFIFFSGKGGVGKTSMASATAVYHADQSRKTLIVTTDPASNLADVFGQRIGHRETAIEGVPNLWAMEIEPDAATEEYRERIIGPMRDVMPAEIIRVVEEQFNSPCTTEIAAFDRFVDFMDAPDYDVVVFDTAPTGHTVRLLELPVDWSKHLEESAKGSGQTCLGPVEAIQASKSKYDRAISALRDPGKTAFVFVVQPEQTPTEEAIRSSEELARIGIHTTEVIINGVLSAEQCQDPFFAKRRAMQEHYLGVIEERFPGPKRTMPLLSKEVAGIPFLREVGGRLYEGITEQQQPSVSEGDCYLSPDWGTGSNGVAGVLRPGVGGRRLVFFAGKGGVGKTVVSCATAQWLAGKGYRTLLVTTDPAAHTGQVLEVPVGPEVTPVPGVPGLYAAAIDQKSAGEEYRARILREASGKYSDDMLAAMREELESPCTEEMAAFEEFVQFATRDDFDVIIFDTAPTGHTLRLLALPMDWGKQVEVMVAAKPGSDAHAQTKARFDRIIALLRDPEQTSFVFVVYPENTPLVEAHRASRDLQEAGIATAAVVVNQVLTSERCITPFWQQRCALQRTYLGQIAERFAVPVAMLPLFDSEIRGLERLEEAARHLWGDGVAVERGKGDAITDVKGRWDLR